MIPIWSESFVVILNDKDAQNLVEMEEDNDDNDINNTTITIKTKTTKSLYQQVTLKIVDNFQGEEASIVIISLVCNFSKSGRHDTIGFLKSTNQSNMLLSRARKGMYLIGNSELMVAKSKDMWAPVINILKARNPPQVGIGMPIVCNKHPGYKNFIVEPEQFA